MKPDIRIEKPRKLTTPYLHYHYVVNFYEVGSQSRKKRYFVTKKLADEFYTKQYGVLATQAGLVAQQNADDILTFRKSKEICAKLGITMEELISQYIESNELLKDKQIPDIDHIFDEYTIWRSENDPNITIGKAIDDYLRDMSIQGCRPDTCHSMQNFLIRVGKVFGREKPLPTMTSQAIESWLIGLNSIKWRSKPGIVPLSLRTKHSYLNLFRMFLSYCRKRGFIRKNPVRNVILPVFVPREPRAYTVPEIIGAIKSTKEDSVHRLYVCLAAFSGMRPKEIGRLRWKDIDTDERKIRLSEDITKMNTRRSIVINDNLMEWLQLWKRYFGSNTLVVPKFDRVRWVFLKWFKRAGFHVIQDGFRHSFASYLQALTNNSEYVCEQLGHTREIFMKHYYDLVRPEDAVKYFAITPNTIKEGK